MSDEGGVVAVVAFARAKARFLGSLFRGLKATSPPVGRESGAQVLR